MTFIIMRERKKYLKCVRGPQISRPRPKLYPIPYIVLVKSSALYREQVAVWDGHITSRPDIFLQIRSLYRFLYFLAH